MYKSKHLQKLKHLRINRHVSRIAYAASIVLIAVHIALSVPVGEYIGEASNSQAKPKATPEPTMIVHEEEKLVPLEVVHSEVDLSVLPGDLYTVEHLDEWEEVATTGQALNSDKILQLVSKCRELLSYECYKGETLVQALAKTVTAEIGGLTDSASYSTARMEEAAVVWCILNRADTYYKDSGAAQVEKVVKAAYQFAYNSWGNIHEGIEDLVVDVLIRWELEKSGLVEECGRVLPQEYLFFHGDGRHNHFRTKYKHSSADGYWDWSLSDPYKEG